MSDHPTALGYGSSAAFAALDGEKEDVMYANPSSCKLESIPVEFNTRYVQDLANKSQGQSTLVIPPGNNIKNIVLTLGWNATSINYGQVGGQSGTREVPSGWIYRAIKTMSFRVGGSSQFFLTGEQLLQRNLRMVSTQSQADAMLSLGGNAAVGTALSGDQIAYAPLSCFVSPQLGAGLQFGIHGDLLAQQVVITIDLNPASAIFTGTSGQAGLTDVVPTFAFDIANWTVQQDVMVDRGMSLVNQPGVNLNTHQYAAPLNFDQQAFQISIPAGSAGDGGVRQVTATGFRAGLCNSIQLYLQDATNSVTADANRLVYQKPKAVQVIYAGVIYSNFQSGSSSMWGLINGTKPPSANTDVLKLLPLNAGWASSGGLTEYVSLPFGNVSAGADHEADVLTAGKAITNGIVNLVLTVPDPTKAYTCSLIYNYTAAMCYSASTAELKF
jgi:hypothetical protein